MKSKLTLCALLVASVSQAQLSQGSVSLPKTLSCVGDSEASFTLSQEPASESGISAKIEGEKNIVFQSHSLTLVEMKKGFHTQQTLYADSLGGQLTVTKSIFIGRGGCGRGLCDGDSGFYSAEYKTNANAEALSFDCY